MKMTTFLFFLLSYISFAQNNKSDLLTQEVLEAQSARITAMIEADIDKLDVLLTDDLTYAHTTG